MSRKDWNCIAEEFEDFAEQQKKKAFKRVNREIFVPIYHAKQKDISSLQNRADTQNIVAIQEFE